MRNVSVFILLSIVLIFALSALFRKDQNKEDGDKKQYGLRHKNVLSSDLYNTDTKSIDSASSNDPHITDGHAYRFPRATIEFRRLDDYNGGQESSVPSYTEDIDKINIYLETIQALLKPVHFRKVISNTNVLEQILLDSADPEQIIHELNRNTSTKDNTIVDNFPIVFPYGDLDNFTLVELTKDLAPLHTNFVKQGARRDNMDDSPTASSWRSRKDRVILLPRYEEDTTPMYMFFYMGNGMVCKLRLWVGTDIGWEINYLGMWPHASISFSRYTVFQQIAGLADSSSSQIMADPGTEVMDVSPDFEFVLGRNPWVRFDQITPKTLDKVILA